MLFQLTSNPLRFLVGHIEIPLRPLNARMAEHHLDDSDIDTIGQQPASAFVTQVTEGTLVYGRASGGRFAVAALGSMLLLPFPN